MCLYKIKNKLLLNIIIINIQWISTIHYCYNHAYTVWRAIANSVWRLALCNTPAIGPVMIMLLGIMAVFTVPDVSDMLRYKSPEERKEKSIEAFNACTCTLKSYLIALF